MMDFDSRLSSAWRQCDDESAEWLIKEAQMALRGSQRLHIERLDPKATIPTRGSDGSAGLDLYALRNQTVFAGQQQNIRTGIAMDIPNGMVGLVWPRSGLAAKHGLDVMAGVIDSDYSGEIIVILRNHSKQNFKVNSGDRIAQIVIQGYNKLEPFKVSELGRDEDGRGRNGFGSTGR